MLHFCYTTYKKLDKIVLQCPVFNNKIFSSCCVHLACSCQDNPRVDHSICIYRDPQVVKWNLITLILSSACISPILNHENTLISFCHPVKPFPGLPFVIRVWVTYTADLFVPISQGTKNGIKYPLIYVCRKISRHN
jgi:hypothetical protein